MKLQWIPRSLLALTILLPLGSLADESKTSDLDSNWKLLTSISQSTTLEQKIEAPLRQPRSDDSQVYSEWRSRELKQVALLLTPTPNGGDGLSRVAQLNDDAVKL